MLELKGMCSCLKLGCLVAEIVLSAANQCLLLKLCCQQRTSVRRRNYVIRSESVFIAELCCLQLTSDRC